MQNATLKTTTKNIKKPERSAVVVVAVVAVVVVAVVAVGAGVAVAAAAIAGVEGEATIAYVVHGLGK